MGRELGHDPVVAVTGCVAQQEGAKLLERSAGIVDHRGRHAAGEDAPDAGDAGATRDDRRRASADGVVDGVDDREPVRRAVVSAWADASRRPGQGLRHDHRRLQRLLRVLRGARIRAGTSGCGPSRRFWPTCARRWPAGAARFSCSARSSITTRRPTIPSCDFPALLEAVNEVTGCPPHPVCQPAPAARLRAAHRRGPRSAGGLQASAPAGAVGLDAGAPADAPAAHARRVSRSRRTHSRGHPERAAIDRYDCWLPRRDGGRLRGHAVADRGGAVPQHVLVQVLGAAEHAGGEDACRTMCTEDEKTRRIVALQVLQRSIQLELHERRSARPGRCWSTRAAGGATGNCRAGPAGTRW